MEEKETQSFDILQMGMISGNEFSDQQLEQILNMGKIRPTEKPDMPPQILWVDDCTLATFGNFSASTGKAKSKKTISISCMVAAALKNGTVLKYRACLPKGKDKILYFDTEQSRYHCHNVLSRILRLAGLPTDRDCDRITFVGLREFTPTLRISLIDYALRKSRGYGLVIIDGLRDLMYDINNAKEATDVMTKLMSWTSKYNLHIHCVLHLNKNDNNTRGHIGTELENKAETVLVVSKDKKNASISEVRPMHMRDREFASFAFSIGDDAMPVLVEGYQAEVKRTKEVPLTSLDDEVHREILNEYFGDYNPPVKYVELVDTMRMTYAEKGYRRGTNQVKALLKRLMERDILTKDREGYHYHDNFGTEQQV